MTVNPLMGRDAVEPFVAAARAAGAGVLVLVRTSNPGAADIEDLELRGRRSACGSGSRRSWTSSARPGVGEAGLSDVGAVVGATAPGHLARARELMPQRALPAARRGRAGRARGGARARRSRRAARAAWSRASRSIADAHGSGGEPASPAEAARAR